MSDGFIDLRQNQAHLVDESFWPSFTDIMTVVVMIFLIATSILIVKNWELVKELQTRITVEQKISQRLKASMAAQQKTSQELLASQDKRYQISRKLQLSIEAERRTSEAVKKTSKEKASLEETLAHTQSEMSLIRLQLMQARESATERDRLIVEQDKQIDHMTEIQNKLNQEVLSKRNQLVKVKQQLVDIGSTMNSLQGKLELSTEALTKREQELEEQLVVLTDKEEKLAGLSKQNQIHLDNIRNYEAQIAFVKQTNTSLTDELELQQDALARKDEKLADLNDQNQIYLDNISDYEQQIALAQQKQATLADDYDSLEEKYNKLIKPSRSAIGKHVVEVRYEKLSGKELIQFRPSEKGQYQAIAESVLHKKLLKLKEQYKKTLYVKIIIPDNSGLSYNEAWTFMMGILEKYDYYYQE
ncbi:MAG: hypothetical protein KZQ64_10370 [gamma proteobacterium symbiont of Bathyaustriella thionipta]|nr:hypothetical protein [gamma proteobacterium symbiont of Bathyaustriella thionipta]MCU7948949.1 hypothetical protein [gamma proteobacterium symbiont of Bathyaustriella thionipta]MCU7953776.1 hypothetical protein [gamma proteobacterium symbiont of Bathyaustriella thionipta]MCU7955450.1 hypothetical protein [gamma proteobacterium symbiont of Bathyaustriella thionipta]MCU7966827.1 hypothetical protein [gamma proteobacterium symbiont of Bathyaustriella thionipta]